MALDLSKLQNVKKAAHGKSTARCPACAVGGGDEKGNHLVLYADGKYGCVANPDDKAHRQEIYALAGGRTGAGTPTKISVEAFQVKDTYVVMDLGRFGRFSMASRQKTPRQPEPPPVDVPAPPAPMVAEAAPDEPPPPPPSVVTGPVVNRPPLPKPPSTVGGVPLDACRRMASRSNDGIVNSPANAMSDEITEFLAA